MGFREIIIGFLLVGLFLIAMLNFSIELSAENNATSSLQDDPRINDTLERLKSNYSALERTAESQRENFETTSPILTLGEIVFETIIGAGFSFFSGIIVVFTLTFGLVFDYIFGGSAAFAIVIGTITIALLMSVIFLLWRVFKAGE